MDNYTSVLFIIRGDKTEVYQNGLPIGYHEAGAFVRLQHKLPNGAFKPAYMDLDAIRTAIDVSLAIDNR